MSPKLLPDDRLGKMLAELRVERGLTQAALGQKMRRAGKPVSQPEVARWEGGGAHPEYDTIVMWAEALDVPLSVFFEPAADGDVLDEWGLARVRAMEKLIDLLNGDQETFRLLAQSRADLSRAARLEAEKAPTLNLDITRSSRELLRMAWEEWRALDRGVSRRPPETPGESDSPPAGEVT